MHEHDGHRALPHRRGDPLGRLGPHVADREHAGDAALQVVRRPVERPLVFFLVDVRAGQHEAAAVACHDAVEPGGPGRRANEDEQLAGIHYFCAALRQVPQGELLQVAFPVGLRDLGAAADSDVGDARDLLDEVVRHGLLKGAGAHQHGDRAGELGQVDRGLPGRVGPAHHVHVLALAPLGLGERRAVEDARTGHLRAPGGRQLPVGDPGREDDRLGGNRAAVAEPDGLGRAAHLNAGHLARRQQLRAELDGLPPRPVGELTAGQAVREAEVVLDAARLARLAAGGVLLDEDRAQALGRAVDRRAEPARAAAHHDEVVEVVRRDGRQLDLRRYLGVRRCDERFAVGGDEHGKLAAVRPGRGEQPLPLVAVRGEPAVRHLVARQEVPQFPRRRRPAVPDQLGFLDRFAVFALPGGHQLIDDRVELLLGRVPGLEQVVVQVHDVDRVDRGAVVRVRGQQHPPGVGVDVHRPLKEIDAGQAGHPVVRDDDRDLVAAQLHLLERVQGLLA